MYIRNILYAICFLCIYLGAYPMSSQNSIKIDSLIAITKTEEVELTQKVKNLLEVVQYYQTRDIDKSRLKLATSIGEIKRMT